MQLVATELRPGNIVIYNSQLHRVMSVTHITPGNWRGMVQCKLRNLKTGNQIEHRFRSVALLTNRYIERRCGRLSRSDVVFPIDQPAMSIATRARNFRAWVSPNCDRKDALCAAALQQYAVRHAAGHAVSVIERARALNPQLPVTQLAFETDRDLDRLVTPILDRDLDDSS